MGSSPGFGSNPCNIFALLRLAFAAAPQRQLLNQATKINSPAHSSIGTPSSLRRRTLTACKHTVSGSISLPLRGTFHLSLTVLVHYRSFRVFSLASWSRRLPTRFLVSRGTQEQERSLGLSPTGLSPSMVARSRDLWLGFWLVTPCSPSRGSPPALQHPNDIGLETVKSVGFGLLPFRSPLLREYFPFLGVLRCFSSPGSPPDNPKLSECPDITRDGLPHSGIPGYAC